MNTIARFLLLAVCGTLATGCGRDAQPANNERDAMKYTSAEVKIIRGDLAGRTKRIEDQAGIRRLLSQFPGVGTGKKGPEPPAPWINALVIQFTRSDGTVLRVTCSAFVPMVAEPKGDELYFWSEGLDDWLVDDPKEFQSYFRKLFEEKPKPAKDEKQ